MEKSVSKSNLYETKLHRCCDISIITIIIQFNIAQIQKWIFKSYTETLFICQIIDFNFVTLQLRMCVHCTALSGVVMGHVCSRFMSVMASQTARIVLMNLGAVVSKGSKLV